MKYKKVMMKSLALCLLLLAGIGSSWGAEDSRPNVIMIAMDDLNNWIGPMGDTQVKTPNLDRLAKMGITFQNAHTVGIFCAPSRASLFTGRLPSTTGVYEESPTPFHCPQYRPLQVALQEAGYETYGTGKLYHHTAGFLDLRGWTDYFMQTDQQKKSGWGQDTWDFPGCPLPNPYPHSPYSEGKVVGGLFMEQGPLKNEEEPKMADTMRTQWAVDLLGKKHDKPFFIGVGLYVPHFPNYVPQKYFDLYDKSTLQHGPWKEDDLDDLPGEPKKKQTNAKKKHDKVLQLGILNDVLQGYLAATSYGDAMVGRLLDALEKSPYKDNTIIVLWSDNGYHLGEKFQWGKHTLWQKTTNVPMMWAGPKIASGKSITTAASLIDIYPSLVELCGLTQDSGLEGKSLATALQDPSKAEDRPVTTVGLSEGEYATVNSEWRYIHYKDGGEELYNRKEDPNEWTNVVSNPEYQKIKEQMKAAGPSTFAAPGKKRGELTLVSEGEKFHWEEKKAGAKGGKGGKSEE